MSAPPPITFIVPGHHPLPRNNIIYARIMQNESRQQKSARAGKRHLYICIYIPALLRSPVVGKNTARGGFNVPAGIACVNLTARRETHAGSNEFSLAGDPWDIFLRLFELSTRRRCACGAFINDEKRKRRGRES